MKTSAILGFGILGLLWIWLSWGVLSAGVTLYSLLVVAISGAMVFVPLWRKYGKGIKNDNQKNKHKR